MISVVQENDPTLKERMKQSDAREIQSFYYNYYKKYIQALQNAADKADRSVATWKFSKNILVKVILLFFVYIIITNFLRWFYSVLNLQKHTRQQQFSLMY